RAGVFAEPDNGPLWRDSVEKNPGAWLALYNLGLMELRQGRPQDALALFEQAESIRPDAPEVLYQLGYLQSRSDSPEVRAAAIGHLREALRIYPDFPAAHLVLGKALASEGKSDEALSCFQRAVELSPGLAEAYRDIAHIWQARKNHSEA